MSASRSRSSSITTLSGSPNWVRSTITLPVTSNPYPPRLHVRYSRSRRVPGEFPESASASLIAAFMIRFGSTSPQGSCKGSCTEVIGTVLLAVGLLAYDHNIMTVRQSGMIGKDDFQVTTEDASCG